MKICTDVSRKFSIVFQMGAICLVLCAAMHAQQVDPTAIKCVLDVPNGVFAPEKEPVLFGTAFKVPDLRFQFVSKSENLPSIVRVFYIWEWFEYPARGRSGGVWDDAGDIVECSNVGKMNIVIPAYNVVPKGWYSGEFANGRKNIPKFDHIEVAFETKECGAPRLLFDKKEIEKFRKMVALVSLPCGGLPKYEFLKEGSFAD